MSNKKRIMKKLFAGRRLYKSILNLVDNDPNVDFELITGDRVVSDDGRTGKGLYNNRLNKIFLASKIKNTLGGAYILAHEYAHYFDHFTGDLDNTLNNKSGKEAAIDIENRACFYALIILYWFADEKIVYKLLKEISMPPEVITNCLDFGDSEESKLHILAELLGTYG